MTLCAEYGFAVNPQGGNSGMVNGSVPQGEVLISLQAHEQGARRRHAQRCDDP